MKIFIIVLIVLGLLIWLVKRNGKVDVFAKGVAKAQLRSFYAFQHHDPNLSKRELYVKTISMRPGYRNGEAEGLVKEAEERLKGGSILKLKDVVYQLALKEYINSTSPRISMENGLNILVIKQIIDESVPDNL